MSHLDKSSPGVNVQSCKLTSLYIKNYDLGEGTDKMDYSIRVKWTSPFCQILTGPFGIFGLQLFNLIEVILFKLNGKNC